MGINTTSFNIDELITSYADNQITDTETKKHIEDLLSKDQKLYAKYRCEVLTRDLFRNRLNDSELPPVTINSVIASIDNLIAESKKKFSDAGNLQFSVQEYPTLLQSLKQAFIEKFIGVPRYAFAILAFVLIGGLVVFYGGKKTKNPYILTGKESSIMVQALSSFQKVMKGEVKPQLTSSNSAEIEKFVMEKAHFDPFVPEIENYKLAGVVCNNYRGQDLAHLIYQDNNGQLIYIFQVPISAMQKKNLEIPEDVHNEITKANFYMCDEVDENDCTMTLWYKENTLCASMTTLPKQEMYATFTRFNK